jgi:L-phenylalanine/L-methionine N-acetyltransferase
MNIVIRPVAEPDHQAIHEILMSPHVLRGSMRVPFSPPHQTAERLAFRRGVYQLAAVSDGQVVGFAELVTAPDEPRHRHVGDINLIATHADWGGRGIGRRLMDALIDLADNWLNLPRLGLIVFTGNTHAVRLYERLGFTIEGTMPRFGYGDGTWMDAHVMGRLRP